MCERERVYVYVIYITVDADDLLLDPDVVELLALELGVQVFIHQCPLCIANMLTPAAMPALPPGRYSYPS